MIGIGTSLLFDRRAGKAGPPIPPFNKAMVDAWFMSGLSNIDKPSSIKGVMGNEMALKNFTYTAGSGFGMYNTSFKGWRKVSGSADYIITDTYVKVTTHYEAEGNRPIVGIAAEDYNNVTFKVRAEFTDYSYTPSNTDGVRLSLIYVDNMGSTIAAGENVITPGLNTVYKFDLSSVPEECLSTALVAIIVRGKGTIQMDIEREEGALVFDGVDDYGICTGLPILDDYTVICRREIINKDYYSVASKSTVFGKGAFVFEIIQGRTNHCYSFAADNQINLYNSEISWQTKNSYNGSTITVGNGEDTDTLTLGIVRVGDKSNRYLEGAIFYFALYNKSLTIEEIETEKERLNEEWLKRKN
jgi:hypothetical protein